MLKIKLVTWARCGCKAQGMRPLSEVVTLLDSQGQDFLSLSLTLSQFNLPLSDRLIQHREGVKYQFMEMVRKDGGGRG